MARSKHDQFVSRSLEHPAIARALFEQYTPPHTKDHPLWDTLHRIDRSGTDLRLKKSHRDMVYKASMKQGGKVIFGLEHQSDEDTTMQTRYMRYDANVLEACQNEGDAQWPLMINLLLYNGCQSPSSPLSAPIGYYRYTIDGQELLYLFFYLINLLQISDEELLTHGLCAPMEILLKHCFDGKFELKPSAYRATFQACVKEVGDDYIYSMLEYVDSLPDFKIGKKMHKFVKSIFSNKSEFIMTYAKVLTKQAKDQGIKAGVKKGMREGMKEGMQSKALAIAKDMVRYKEPIEKIMKYTGLNLEVIETLKQE